MTLVDEKSQRSGLGAIPLRDGNVVARAGLTESANFQKSL